MATKTYNLPGGLTTPDLDEHIQAWRALARPLEQALGLELAGYDPDFMFRLGNAQSPTAAYIRLPLWFVKKLTTALSTASPVEQGLRDVMMVVQDQLRTHESALPQTFDKNVMRWVDDTVAGRVPNLRG